MIPDKNKKEKLDLLNSMAFRDATNVLKDFNTISTCLGLFHAKNLRNRVQYLFIFAFFEQLLFAHGPIEFKLLSNRLTWTIDRSLTRIIISGQSETGSNGKKGEL